MKRMILGLVALAAAPLMAQEPSPVRLGVHLEYALPGGSSTPDGIKGTGDNGSQGVKLYGLGVDFPVYFGRLLGDRYFPVKLWPGVVYRQGRESDSLTAPSLETSLAQGGTATLYGVTASRETKASELTIQLPVRWYFGWDRQYTEGPYIQGGPFYVRHQNKVNLNVSGSSAGAPVVLNNSETVTQTRIGWMLGAGVSWSWYETRMHFGADYRKVNNPTIQAKGSFSAYLGFHY